MVSFKHSFKEIWKVCGTATNRHWPVKSKCAHQWIPLHIIISSVLPLACIIRPYSALSGPSQRSAQKPEGLLESNLRRDKNTEKKIYKTGTEEKENP